MNWKRKLFPIPKIGDVIYLNSGEIYVISGVHGTYITELTNPLGRTFTMNMPMNYFRKILHDMENQIIKTYY